MSSKIQEYYKTVKNPEQSDILARQGTKPGYPFSLKYVLLTAILAITFWCYHYSLNNEFINNWDDTQFISENNYIKSFSATNLKMMLFHDITQNYYNPLSIISYAVNYHFAGLTPRSYYFTNIIIHLMNTCLVFFLVLMLFEVIEKKGYGTFKGKEWLAFFCTLAFAIHPMHVESVSWIAERKDVLYAFFYFAGMIAYIKYAAKSEELKSQIFRPLNLYFLAFSLYLLSVLSKPMAVVFPFSLLAMDVLLKRDKSASIRNILLEKLPFAAVSVSGAIMTYHLQKAMGAMAENGLYSFFRRFCFASYNFYMYIAKAFVPIPQSTYYPFPGATGHLSLIFYISPLIALAVVAIPLYFSYRRGENYFRIVLFGLGFYFFNMVVVSQIINVGLTLMADRYSYVCYFGLFFPITYFIYKSLLKNEWRIKLVGIIISIYIILLATLCYKRTYVWHSTETVWQDAINKYPRQIGLAYIALGNYYFNLHEPAKAYNNYREAMELHTNDLPELYNLGLMLNGRKQYDSALLCFTILLSKDSSDATTYLNRGNTYSGLGKYDLALLDYRHAYRMNPHIESSLTNMASTYFSEQQFDSAISCYNKAILINPANPWNFHYRGITELYKDSISPALSDFMEDLRLAPHDSECMYYLSITYHHIKDFNNAYKYAQMAQNAQYPVPPEYARSLQLQFGIK